MAHPPPGRLAGDVQRYVVPDPARHSGGFINTNPVLQAGDAVEAGCEALKTCGGASPRPGDPGRLGQVAACPARHEAFAALVRESGHTAPSLRPSNPARAVFHVMGGTSGAMMVEHVLPPSGCCRCPA